MGNQTATETVELPEPKPEPVKVFCEHCQSEQLPDHECFPIEPMSCW